LCAPDRGGAVKFTLKKGGLQVSASSQSLEFEDEIGIEYDGDEFKIAFNPSFVLDALKNMDSEQVKLSLTSPVNPALLEPVGDEGYRCVVMPMRV
jgi:DNA polymerase-3 subunit beta